MKLSLAAIAAIIAVVASQVPHPQKCSGPQSGIYAYGTLGSGNGNNPGYTITLFDVGNGCANQSIYQNTQYFLDSYSAMACNPSGDASGMAYTSRRNGNKYWTMYTGEGHLNFMQDYVSVVKLATTKNGIISNLYGTGGTEYKVATLDIPNSIGNIKLQFSIQNDYKFNNIAAYDSQNDIWYALAYDQDTQDSIMYIINVAAETVATHPFSGVIPIDMFYDVTTGNVYFVYTDGGVNQCNTGYVPPRPTNPRLRSASLGTVSTTGSINSVANINFQDCLRLHAISTWDSTNLRYIFYAQEDFGSDQNSYHNGIGYVDVGSKPSGDLTGVVGGYWGDGIAFALYSACPSNM